MIVKLYSVLLIVLFCCCQTKESSPDRDGGDVETNDGANIGSSAAGNIGADNAGGSEIGTGDGGRRNNESGNGGSGGRKDADLVAGIDRSSDACQTSSVCGDYELQEMCEQDICGLGCEWDEQERTCLKTESDLDQCTAGEPVSRGCLCDGTEISDGFCCALGPSEEPCIPNQAVYIREGSDGDGSDWNNALGQLPEDLSRGTVYFVADGEYAGRSFDDPASGDEVIFIRKATTDSYGTEVGWEESYGDDQAVFGPMVFVADHYNIDGRKAYGIKILGGDEGPVIDVSSDDILIRYADVDGNFTLSGGVQVGGACNGIDIHGADVTLDRCDIHNIADDGVGVYGDRILISDSRIHELHGCGTDGGCGPCYNGHSDGLELQSTSDVTIIGNLVYDIESTSGLITGQWSSGNYTRNLTLINNVFYTPATGFAAYLYYVQGARVYHNIFWGRIQGSRYGGLAIGPEMTDLDLRNNIILNINYNHLDSAYDPAEHNIDYNIFGVVAESEYSPNSNDLVDDPLFARIPVSENMEDHITEGLQPEDFALTRGSPAIDSGADLTNLADVDFFGVTRPKDGNNDGTAAWDRGPFELNP